MTNEHDIFGRLCRFCGLQRTCGKYIFSAEAVKIGLLTKVKCLFPEEVELINSDTILPKFICNSCELTINYFHDFRNGVKLVQETLLKKFDLDLLSESSEILPGKTQHICSSSRRSEALSIRLDPGGQISCSTCNAKLHPNQIQSSSANVEPICFCYECGYKDEVQMFSSKENSNFNCPKCAYIKKKKMTVEKLDTSKKTYECNICRKVFTCKGHLNRHKLTHYDAKPYACEDCGSRFNQKSSLKTHLLIHQRTSPFSCKWCGQRFRHKQTLANHVVSIHGVASGTENVYECDKCKKRFVQKEKLKRHYRSHSGEKPFKCDVCDRTFTQKVNLKTHYKKHESEGQFPAVCPTGLHSGSDANNHLTIRSVTMPALVNDETDFVDMTHEVLVDVKRHEDEYTNLSTPIPDTKRNEENFSGMSHSVLNETEKGKLIQELLGFENMSPENDSLETFSSIVDNEYQDEDGTMNVSNNSNDVYFNPSASNYIMYSSNSSLYDLNNVSQCSALPTFSSLNAVP